MAQAQQRVSRDDLEAKFRALQGDVQHKINDRKQTLIAGVAFGGMVLLIVFFLLGRRSGKARTTMVEIRRV
jgi:hypothetical protein